MAEGLTLDEITAELEVAEEDSWPVLFSLRGKVTSLGLLEGIFKSERVECDVDSSSAALPIEDTLVPMVTGLS